MPKQRIAATTGHTPRRSDYRRAGLRAALPVLLALALLLATASSVFAGNWSGNLVLTPSEGTPGSTVTATAHGAPAGDPVVIGYTTGDCSGTVTTITTGTVDNGGGVSITFPIPNLAPGTYTICVTDQKTHQSTKATLTVLAPPSIKISSPVISGQPITVTGTNWLPSTDQASSGTVEVRYGGASGCDTAGGTATVGPDGTFTVTFNAPFETSATTITITAVEPQGACGQTSPPPILQAQATATVAVPTITVPQSVDSGASVTITGANFAPNAGTVEFRYGPQGSNGCATAGGSATVGPDGSFSGTFTAPNETKDTTITVVAFQPQGACGQAKLNASSTLVVKAKPSTTTTPGLPGAPYCVVALLLLLLLLLLLFLLFRRRKKDEPVTIEERDRVVVGAGPSGQPYGGAIGAALIDRQIVARDRRGNEVVIAEEVTTVEEEEEEL
jgi:hypothetical protein